MSRSTGIWIRLFLFLFVLVLPVTLFALQNWSRVTDVSFDWYAGKVETTQPWPVPALLFVSFGVGVFVGLFAWSRERWSSRRRISELESRLIRATADAQRSPKPVPAAAPVAPPKPTEDWA